MNKKTKTRRQYTSPFIDHDGIRPIVEAYYAQPDFNVLLVGDPGIGKTTFVSELAGGPERMVTVIGSKMMPNDLIGRMTLVNGETRFQDGLLTKSMREGLTCYIDELSGLDDACQRILYGVIDHRRELTINANSETIVAHEDFRLIASDNFSPSGAATLNRPFRDRFVHVYMNRLDRDTEHKLMIDQYGLEDADAEWLLAVAAVTRRANNSVGATTRQLELCSLAIASGVPRKVAAQHTLLGSIAGNSRQQFEQLVQLVRAEGLDLDEVWLSKQEMDQFDDLEFVRSEESTNSR
ncbi:MAG TPA: hypothetical protein DDW52_28015 [Planctomycetaceae bacterium]|nr:hypothetical protein [Planctomycetaceae bacterium]